MASCRDGLYSAREGPAFVGGFSASGNEPAYSQVTGRYLGGHEGHHHYTELAFGYWHDDLM